MNVLSYEFYNEYHGHKISHLTELYTLLRATHSGPMIYLAGDSSLDNKFWFADDGDAVNGYEYFLSPPISRQDISYWMNHELVEQGMGKDVSVINCAVEESSLQLRSCGTLLPQDKFIKDTIQADDVLVVSIGQRDLLKPSCCAMFNLCGLLSCTSTSCLEKCSCGCSIPCNDICGGCCCGCLSNICACPCGLGYFIHMFSARLTDLLSRLTATTKPSIVVVCMMYFMDEHVGNSWADTVLSTLGYDRNPAHLQSLIKIIFEKAVQRIKLRDSFVVPVPLFEALNGKNTSDYTQRLIPSPRGGQKIAKFIVDTIIQAGQSIEEVNAATGGNKTKSSFSVHYEKSMLDASGNPIHMVDEGITRSVLVTSNVRNRSLDAYQGYPTAKSMGTGKGYEIMDR